MRALPSILLLLLLVGGCIHHPPPAITRENVDEQAANCLSARDGNPEGFRLPDWADQENCDRIASAIHDLLIEDLVTIPGVNVPTFHTRWRECDTLVWALIFGSRRDPSWSARRERVSQLCCAPKPLAQTIEWPRDGTEPEDFRLQPASACQMLPPRIGEKKRIAGVYRVEEVFRSEEGGKRDGGTAIHRDEVVTPPRPDGGRSRTRSHPGRVIRALPR